MALLENCPTCGNGTSENASICPACGEPLQDGWVNIVQWFRQHKIRDRIERINEYLGVDKRSMRFSLIYLLLFSGFALFLYISEWYDGYKIEQLKENNPIAYRQYIEQLEAEVAKVPREDIEKKLVLYEELNELDPENENYDAKIRMFEFNKMLARIREKNRKSSESMAARVEDRKRKLQERLAEIEAEKKAAAEEVPTSDK